MSKFFQAGSSSDESSSGSESESDEEVQQVGRGKFGAAFDSDSDSEGEGRVVQSKQDKAWDSMRDGILNLNNAKKIGDWSLIQDQFEAMNKLVEKNKMLILKVGLPKMYIKMLGDLETFLGETLKDKDAQAKMAKKTKQALNRMKLSVKKHNINYKAQIEDWRNNPSAYEEALETKKASSSESSDSDSSDSDSDSDGSSQSSSSSDSGSGSDSDSDNDEGEGASDSDDSWPSESESSSSSEDEGDGRTELKGRARWLKRTVDTSAADEKAAKRAEKQDKQAKAKFELKESKKSKSGDAPKRAAIFDENMDEVTLDKKVKEVMSSRGRKGTDVKLVLRHLEVLSRIARKFSSKKEIPILMHLISGMFDTHSKIDDYMSIADWRATYRYLARILDLLDKEPHLTLGVLAASDALETILSSQIDTDYMKNIKTREGKKGAAAAESDDEDKVVDPNELQVVGSVEHFVIRLEEDHTKSLQQINSFVPTANSTNTPTQEYAARIADEASLVELAARVAQYMMRKDKMPEASKMALLQIEHTYYKHEQMAKAVHKAHAFNKKWGLYSDLHPAALGKGAVADKDSHPAAKMGYPSVNPPDFDPTKYMEDLVSFVFKHGEERTKTRALLCSVFHHALHDRYYQARDMFLISHVQDIIEKVEIGTQVLYNRALVTMGVAAFKLGLTQQAHDSLTNICSGRVKELLAQGTSRWSAEKDALREQELKAERRRQVPYHMHINTDLLEACHLVSAMLLELPQLSRSNLNSYPISKAFRKYMMQHNRQVFTGPPENVRDHIMAASKAVMKGEWAKAVAFVLKLDVWNLVPGGGSDKLRSDLKSKLVALSLRVYLLTSGRHYESVRLSHLTELFELDAVTARRVISAMISKKEISAAWEQDEEVLKLYNVSPSSVQTLSKIMAEKISDLADGNERLLYPLSGGAAGYSQKDDAWQGERKGQWQGERRYGARGGGWKGHTPGNMHKMGGRPLSRTGGRKDEKPKANVWTQGKGGSSAYTKRASGGSAPQKGFSRY